MKPSAKISVTEDLIARFRAYHGLPQNCCWGALHIVLDDQNMDDGSVQFCIQWADDKGDTEGKELALILADMSYSQRRKISRMS